MEKQIKRLSLKEKYEILNNLAIQTHDEVIANLEKYGKTMVVRPTGFGKTRMLIQLAKEYALKYPDKKILYIYPLNIIVTEITRNDEYMTDYHKEGRKKVKYSIIKDRVDFVSYQTLTKRYNENGPDFWYNILKDKYSLILLDEVHRAGSEGFNNIYDSIKDLISPSNIHLVGVTATPNRMMDTEDSNVLNNIFNNINISELSLGSLIRMGVMCKLIYAKRIYNTDEIAKTFKKIKKNECIKYNKDFDDNSFNVELAKALKEYGDEPRFIYKYVKRAGYNLKDSSQTYFKFIVFCTNIQDIVDKGPMVEDWFNRAFNDVAKREEDLKKGYTINSYYITSSDTEDRDIATLCEQDKEHRKYFNKTSKLNSVNSDGKIRTVDLLLTVNMINMGYHVEDITGILMLRGTKSEIIYYQQLGRCLSVKSERSPIIYDFVNNQAEKFWFKKDSDRTRKDLENLVNNNPENGYIIDGDINNKDVDMSDQVIIEGDEDVFEDFIKRWDDINYSESSKIKWLYVDKKAPLCIIASDTGETCSDIVKRLLDMNVTLREEDAMYEFISKKAKKDENSNEFKIMKYIFSKKALQFIKDTGKSCSTIFDILVKIIKKR